MAEGAPAWLAGMGLPSRLEDIKGRVTHSGRLALPGTTGRELPLAPSPMLTATSNPQALWYMTRGFGLITLLLLTASTVLGITQVVRFASSSAPRFVVAGLHKNISLLAIVFLSVHIATAVADPYAPIGVVDAFVPFVGRYRPIWLGLGALAN